jgi:NAD+ synthase (glutamine-hydrolysing)
LSDKNEVIPVDSELEEVYRALVLGAKDYINKNKFPGVLIGSSGGIDSALTAVIAADAIGSENVRSFMMPFKFTSDMSVEDADKLAENLGIKHSIIPIGEIYDSFQNSLECEFKGLEPDITEENLQSRCRGVILMALSNKSGEIVLTTGNKSETAVGYSTLYGDTAGGFGVLKDVPKTLVYELARYRNTISKVIPERIIDRPPSAELAPDQQDSDSLPDYDTLDKIIELYVEQDKSKKEIEESGIESSILNRVIRLIDFSEYKRRQAPLGVKITSRGFGKDRRYPITNKFLK